MRVQIEKKKIAILMYHSISCTVNSRFRQFTVSPASFAEQMAYLHQHAYTPMTITQYVRARSQAEVELPERPIVLTFDDGFADFFTDAFPVLKRYGFVATLYIATAFVNGTSHWLQHMGEGTRRMLTWKQLGEISMSNVECGAHSHSHRQLDILPLSIAQDEIVQSKRRLEDHLGREVSSFAYPFGSHTASLRRLIRDAGYTSACAVKYALSSENTDPFALARLMVRADTDIATLSTLLSGSSSSSITTMYMRARTPVWQVARRSSALIMRHLKERLPAG
jgi:peptidoglycan/xylan/chitin deacetylase (PgdA/CDA1 family)